MGDKKLKNSIVKSCVICNAQFNAWYKSTKTCSKHCKNQYASKISKQQFASPEYRECFSKMMIETMANPTIRKKLLDGVKSRRSYKGKNHPTFGKVRDKKWRNAISNGNKGKHKGMTWEEIYGNEGAAKLRSRNRKWMIQTNAKLLNDRTSIIEKECYNYLEPHGYIRNKQVSKYVVDFLNVKKKIIIEIYGDYWHCNPKIYNSNYFNKSIKMTAEEKWKYDERRSQYLKNKGYTLHVLWESDIRNNNIKDIIEKLNP